MIRMARRLTLVALMLIAPIAANAAGVTVVSATSSGASDSLLEWGDVLTVDLVVDNATGLDIFGLGIGGWGYDTGVEGTASDNSLLYIGGSSSDSAFNDQTFPGPISSGGLANVASPPEENGDGPPINNELRLQLFNGAALVSSNGDGSLDVGVDGDLVSNGDVHFRIQFQAQRKAQFLETVNLEFGTGQFGNELVGADGALLPFTNDSLSIQVVPEPGTALLMGLGLVGLASTRRR